MASEKECMSHADECVRLAGLTDDLTVRDQLRDLAQDWIFAAQQGHRRSDDARVVPLQRTKTTTTTRVELNHQTKPSPPQATTYRGEGSRFSGGGPK
jgi:hypothetical protein